MALMPVPIALRLALHALVLDGVAALYLADFVAGPTALGLAVAVALAWWGAGMSEGVRRVLDRVVAPAAAVLSLADLFFLAETVLDGLVRLLLFLVLYKLVTLRTVRDTRPIGFLAFFMLVAAASSAFGLGYLFVFLVFVALGIWVTLVQHVLLDGEGAPGTRAPEMPAAGAAAGWSPGTLAGLAGVAAVGVVGLTAVFFLILPRIGLAALPLRARLGVATTGFSDRVGLSTFGTIATDDTVVMRVHLPEPPESSADAVREPETLAGLRWRGLALDRFDGETWSVRHPRRLQVVRSWGGELELTEPRGVGPVVRQEIYLEPIGTEALFGAPRMLRLHGLRGPVGVDDALAVTLPPTGSRLAYVVESELEIGLPASPLARAPSPSLDPWARRRYLELPPLSPRVHALAREVAAGAHDPVTAAARLVDFFSREFRYTLTIERVSTLDPLEEFLFVRRTGHCEYFAASLGVLLRSLGIPARVVNGFQRGEWNPYGRYFIVRRRDAHAWVEAHLDGIGWTTLDPSPRAGSERWTPPGAISLVLDALRLRWHRYVINWSLGDQVAAVRSVRQQAGAWGPWLTELRARMGEAGLLSFGVAVVALGGVGWRFWRARPVGSGDDPRRIPRFYARALRRLGRAGLRPVAGETAREFSARVRHSHPAAATPFARITAAYEACRFGSRALGPAEEADLRTCLGAVARASRSVSRRPVRRGRDSPYPRRLAGE